jgi:hypothetical protein
MHTKKHRNSTQALEKNLKGMSIHSELDSSPQYPGYGSPNTLSQLCAFMCACAYTQKKHRNTQTLEKNLRKEHTHSELDSSPQYPGYGSPNSLSQLCGFCVYVYTHKKKHRNTQTLEKNLRKEHTHSELDSSPQYPGYGSPNSLSELSGCVSSPGLGMRPVYVCMYVCMYVCTCILCELSWSWHAACVCMYVHM